MTDIKLSYVLTTFNKLGYLETVIKDLIRNCMTGEEIIVIDGGSSDGTKEFLKTLFEEGKIHQYITEKDYGEAHGFNKGILMASGELIKVITDDDVFDFDVIQECKTYMLNNKSVDVLFANIASVNSSKRVGDLVFAKSYVTWFREWQSGLIKNCFVCGLSILLRRTALPYIGLFDTSFKHVDVEYTVRITSRKVNVTFYTGLMVAAVMNADSISHVSGAMVHDEIRRVSDYYNYTYPIGVMPAVPQIHDRSLKGRIMKRLRQKPKVEPIYYPDYNYTLRKELNTSNFLQLYQNLALVIKNYNKINKAEFIECIKY
ncbi:MAG: glycosyltransferase [Ferruginibacter sp.]|nr:glycosyltransferase [Ferruginibacter sp.]